MTAIECLGMFAQGVGTMLVFISGLLLGWMLARRGGV